jgi:hypothetical protein
MDKQLKLLIKLNNLYTINTLNDIQKLERIIQIPHSYLFILKPSQFIINQFEMMNEKEFPLSSVVYIDYTRNKFNMSYDEIIAMLRSYKDIPTFIYENNLKSFTYHHLSVEELEMLLLVIS